MFGMSENLPDGYLLAHLGADFPAGANAPLCRRCGALVAPARDGVSPTPFEVHDQWHASLEVRPNGG